ncbi:MAG: NAD(P)H-binding protein [Gammaproteobacteria bacterium]|nr:NAD(P)H-binding protein [Gammaproteobacteria bacterium]
MKTAIVIGATGVTGRPLVKELLADDNYSSVKVFSRRALDFEHDNLVVRIVDFDQLEQWQDDIVGDELFSAMGTTLKQAGSKAAQYKIDYTYQAGFFEAAAKNHVRRLLLVSSPGANSKSPVFYTRTKGKLEEFATRQVFEQRVFFRPSLILGDRPDNRVGEKLAQSAFRLLPMNLPLIKRYRPIRGEQLARAMVNFAQQDTGSADKIFEFDEIFNLLEQ